MNQPPVFMKKIFQKNNGEFTVEWSDGEKHDYRLSTLQKHCPCAKCFDPSTGKQRSENIAGEDVRAIRLTNVGRYALRVQFTSGCSLGIYSFAMLRQLNKECPDV